MNNIRSIPREEVPYGTSPVSTSFERKRGKFYAAMQIYNSPKRLAPLKIKDEGIVSALGNKWFDSDVGSSHPGAGEGPKGPAVRRLKRYASWVQNVVRQFGLYPVYPFEI
jgi:hypothetical protein